MRYRRPQLHHNDQPELEERSGFRYGSVCVGQLCRVLLESFEALLLDLTALTQMDTTFWGTRIGYMHS